MNTTTKTVKPDLMEHQRQKLLLIRIPLDPKLIREVKKTPNIRWSPGLRVWPRPYQDGLAALIEELLDAEGSVEDGELHEKLRLKVELKNFETTYADAFRQFEDWMLIKRYSDQSRKNYIEALKVSLKFNQPKSISEIRTKDLILFHKEYILRRGYSASYQNQIGNALKLFFQTIENRSQYIKLLHRPRRQHRLPNVWSKEEVKRILEANLNLKHKTMLSLIYACGLRRSELLDLLPADIQFHRNLLKISQSKGKKYRIEPVSDKLIELLRKYYKEYSPQTWLFEGQQRGSHYSE